MKFFVISVLLFFHCGSAFSLKCYECNEGVSYKRNDTVCYHPEEIVCVVGMEMCTKKSVFVNGRKVVSKGCVPKCAKMQFSVNVFGAQTDINCCQGDLCNGSEKVSKNKLLFSAVAVYAFFKLFF